MKSSHVVDGIDSAARMLDDIAMDARKLGDCLVVPVGDAQQIVRLGLQASTKPQADAPMKPLQWPVRRDVARLEDMRPDGYLRVTLDTDNDVCVETFDGRNFTQVEFCNPGGGGGGKSRRTRLALIELMRAIEADNAESPEYAHPHFGRTA